jgi:GrpB-like predicted nucleotidyltransferase (UPF0157 family)
VAARVDFRDALRSDAALAAAYAELKLSLARSHPGDRATYTEEKSAFIERVLSSRENTTGEELG